jgi:hypothetical protein
MALDQFDFEMARENIGRTAERYIQVTEISNEINWFWKIPIRPYEDFRRIMFEF